MINYWWNQFLMGFFPAQFVFVVLELMRFGDIHIFE